MVICKEHFSTVSATFDWKDCCVAELAAVGNAYELTASERWAFVACILCGFGQPQG